MCEWPWISFDSISMEPLFSFVGMCTSRCVCVVSVINSGIQRLCRIVCDARSLCCPGSIPIMPCNWRLCFTLPVIYIFRLASDCMRNSPHCFILALPPFRSFRHFSTISQSFCTIHCQIFPCRFFSLLSRAHILTQWINAQAMEMLRSPSTRRVECTLFLLLDKHFIQLIRSNRNSCVFANVPTATCNGLFASTNRYYNFRNQIPLLLHSSQHRDGVRTVCVWLPVRRIAFSHLFQ